MASAAELRALVDAGKQKTRDAMVLVPGIKDEIDQAIAWYQGIRTDKPEIAEAINALQAMKHRLDELSILAMNSDSAADRYAVRL